MVKNYFLLTSKLFAPMISVLGEDLVSPNLSQKATIKKSILMVFLLFLAVPSVLKATSKQLTNSTIKSQIFSRNYLLDFAAIVGRGGGGGGGHGGVIFQVLRI